MPKLPLDPDRLRQLPGAAIRALRRPRRTAAQVVRGSFTLVGSVVGRALDRRPTTEPVPGMARPPEEAVPPPTEAAAAAPEAPEAPAPTAPDEAPAAAPTESAAGTEPADADGPTEDVPEEHLTGPTPHIPPGIAREVERDYEDDIPGITPRGS
ncbi:hypothetical protein [Nocardioides sp. KR10-350]|uniref:hypothetical protein n=1 Tax=Nocardioides cheoyonin TaxID=3156615 RepID=UPI0032B3B43B